MSMKAPARGQATVPGRDYDALLDILEAKDAEIKRLKESMELFASGWDHFLSRINFGESALDAESIRFMNDVPIAMRRALAGEE